MKANELRIGNLITINNSVYWTKLRDIPLIVTHIGQTMNIKGETSHSVGCEHINQKPNTYYETYSQFIENIKPIQLTEEWLLRFGFDLVVKEGNQGKFRVYQLNEITYNTNNGWWWKHHLTVQPKYIHELQNLYFALAGTELTIK